MPLLRRVRLPQLDGRIRSWHLLSHRSGLFDYMWDGETYEELAFGPPARSDPRRFLEAALRYPLRNFGQVAYSSSNYAAIDLILEQETCRSLGDLLREHVFEPYGLSRTTFQVGLEPPPDVAHGYAFKGGTFRRSAAPGTSRRSWIDRAVATDVYDLASFFRRLLREHPTWSSAASAFRVRSPHGELRTATAAQRLATPSSDAQTVTASTFAIAVANSHSFPVIRAVVTAPVEELF